MHSYYNQRTKLLKYISKFKNKSEYITSKLTSLLLGFLIANILSTMPAQTGDSGIIAASIIITFNEIASKIIYKKKYTILNLFK